jgi:hypothetical protein
LKVRFPVTCWKEERLFEASATTVSMGGCSLTTLSEIPLEVGQVVRLSLKPTHTESLIDVEAAAVRWARRDLETEFAVNPRLMPSESRVVPRQMVGLEFLRFGPAEEERFRRFVRSLLVAQQQER